MNNMIPLSVINRQDFTLLYFDLNDVKTPERIDKAYILSNNYCGDVAEKPVEVFINDSLSEEDYEFLNDSLKGARTYGQSGNVIADISENVKMLVSEYIPNWGITIKKQLQNPRLMITYHKDTIYPNCECNSFFDKEIFLSGYNHNIQSPWFCTAYSQTITFFAQNAGCNDIAIYLQYSPDRVRSVNDPQQLIIRPEETVDIIPYKFSKFTRMAAHSEHRQIALRMWFQTQLTNH